QSPHERATRFGVSARPPEQSTATTDSAPRAGGASTTGRRGTRLSRSGADRRRSCSALDEKEVRPDGERCHGGSAGAAEGAAGQGGRDGGVPARRRSDRRGRAEHGGVVRDQAR